jgi:CheY-like chemotaxis protein
VAGWEIRVSVIFLDISLPDLDGVEVLRRIRADESLRELPVVALTAHAMMGDGKRFLDVGFDDYLNKPNPRSSQDRRSHQQRSGQDNS